MLTQETVPHIRKGGSIVYVASVGVYLPFAQIGAYSISKTALFGLTRTLAQECGPLGIRVNCLAPGLIKTDFSAYLFEDKKYLTNFKEALPLKRTGKTEEMAGTVSFMLDQRDASYLTGETIAVTGGMMSHL